MAGPATARDGNNNNKDNDLINFDVIELHKENIQSLPGGRSARQLASILSPLPSSTGKSMSSTKAKTAADTPLTLDETKTMNDTYRQGYEDELQAIADADDPLDVYVRYVNWTLNTYPSAQATPQSQLLPLLERATKAFQSSSQYKNDSRYLRLWLHYIRLFDTTPRETFAYLARHGIGEKLGLFYEEFASWLEGADRWLQADEVYQLGIQREATPAERLLRKYNQFQQRYNARPQSADGPTSPALPTVRPALAAKTDPFASARGEEPPTTQRQSGGSTTAPTSRSGKPKMAIFSDADSAAPAPAPTGSATTNGWDTIGSMKERKKENTHEARPWAGETLKAGKKVGTAGKMEIFKDPSSRDKNESRSTKSPSSNATSKDSRQTSTTVNPRTGRSEKVFVDIDAVYPANSNTEYSFEELRAISRGWFKRDWKARPQSSPKRVEPLGESMGNLTIVESPAAKFADLDDVENQSQSPQQEELSIQEAVANISIHDVSTQSMVGMPEPERHSQSNSQASRPKEKKFKTREVKQETQTVKTRLESPTGRKLKRKNSAVAEPTMTFHSKAATNDIYDMFNQPLRRPELARDDTQSGDDGDFTEGDLEDGYSTAGDGESTGTGRASLHGSEYGEDTLSQPNTQPDSVSPWSDFTASKHVPSVSVDASLKKPSRKIAKSKTSSKSRRAMSEDMTENMDSSSQNATQTSGLGGFDTQAIAAIANADFDDMDTKAIAMLAGDLGEELDADHVNDVEEVITCDKITTSLSPLTDLQTDLEEPQQDSPAESNNNRSPSKDVVLTPVDEGFDERYEVSNPTRFVPIAPVDYEPTPFRSYRDPNMMAQNKLPFMTPIVERTESSFAPSTVFNDPDYFNSKTPSRPGRDAFESPSKLMVDNLLLSSPQEPHESPVTPGKRKISHDSDREEADRDGSPNKRGPGLRLETDIGSDCPPTPNLSPLILKQELKKPELPTETKARPVLQQTKIHKGPVVLDLQCNPCDDAVRQQILTTIHPPPSSYGGYYDHSEQVSRQYQTLKAYAEKLAKTKVKASPRKGQSEKTPNKASPPILRFQGTTQVYAARRQLGEGAFAPVYLVESYNPKEIQDIDADADKENSVPGLPQASDRGDLEALKTEAPPGTLAWEFHVLRLVRQRLGPASRTMESIILAHECHLYRDEAYLVLSYSPQGTLLDLVNLARNESVKAGKIAEGLDESLAMFFSIELLRTLEDLHRVGILHGDLKGDNCLVRLDPDVEIEDMFNADGKDGWRSKGLKLIDFGRGIDVRMFQPQAQFIADWPSTPQDCAEIRECRPWKYQIDYHGAAGVIHSLLFGKYIETIPVTGGGLGQKKEWKLKDNLKRYWEKELWSEVFTLLLNPGIVADGEEMPVLNNLKNVRVKMETWLVEEGERGGRDLRGNLRKMERLIALK
ncbi:hypothetical protein LTR84_007433 [Exophiala bonariae]|uniref:Protein kinase domain-containing protein n=1 Tax=Exophiala bonariae TaxID=1690606 RepID=A0AAV9MYV3_9EURO|nr:hypothetical protein LTR84_007433 [Exophiala bonariae]